MSSQPGGVPRQRSHLRAQSTEPLEPRHLLSEFYLAPTGLDGAAGDIVSPWRTLAYALATVAPGDTITLRGGTYAGDVWITKPNLTLRSYTGENAVISSPRNDRDVLVTVRVDSDAHNTRLIGLEIVGGYYYALKTESTWDTGVPNPHGPSGLLVQDCKLHDSGADVIKLTPATNNGTITRSEIYNSGRGNSTNSEGIDAVQANNFIVSDNYIHDIDTNGVYFKGGSVGTIIERNRVARTGYSGILLGQDTDIQWFDRTVNPNYYESIDSIVRNNIVWDTMGTGIGAWAALRPQIYNNTLYDVSESWFGGILVQAQEHWIPNSTYTPSTDVTMYNNIVYVSSDRPLLEIRENGLTGSLTLSNNIYYNSTRPVVIRDYTRSFEGSLPQWKLLGFDANTLEASPLLDTAAGHQLTPASPAIDAGKAAPISTDFLGNPRPSGLAFDIGAYEFHSSTLLPPSNFRGSNMGPNQVALSWTNTTPDAPVQIEIATDAGFVYDVSRTELPALSTIYTWSGVKSNVPYHFRIRAVSGQSFSSWVPAQVTTTYIPIVPNVPAAPVIVSSSSTHVQLAWTAPPLSYGIVTTGYLLERSTSSDFTTALRRLTFTDAVLGYLDTDIQTGVTYYYRVIATNSSGWSYPSSGTPVTLLTPVNERPRIAAPPVASPAVVTDTSAALSILGADDAGESALTYTWTNLAHPAGAFLPTFSVNSSNAARNTVARFTSVGLYTLQCTVTDAYGLSAVATLDVNVVGVNVTIPLAPTPFTATTQGAGQILVQWSNVDLLTSHLLLDRSTAPNFSRDLVSTPLVNTATSHTATGLLANVTYYFRLRASNGPANSPWVIASATTSTSAQVPQPPSGLLLLSASAGQISFSWSTPPSPVSGYILERATEAGFQESYSVQALPSSATSYLDRKAGSSVTWHYRLRACNSFGWSDPYTFSVSI